MQDNTIGYREWQSYGTLGDGIGHGGLSSLNDPWLGSLYYGIGNSGVSCLHGSHWLGLISVEFATWWQHSMPDKPTSHCHSKATIQHK